MKEKQKRILVAFCIGIFLCMLDTTVMNITLPAIKEGFGVSLTQLSWALNVYTIVFASLTIPLSRFSDYIGKEKAYIAALILFLFSSLLCGVSQNINMLIIGRIFQGISASVLFPLSMIIGISTVNLEKRSTAIAFLGVSQGFAAAMGPTIGGIVTQFWGWHFVFIINIPLIIISLVLCFSRFKFNDKINLQNILSIDYLGSFLAMVSMFSFTVVIININDWGWNSLRVLSLLIIGIIMFSLFIANERKHKNPIIPLNIFQDKQFFATSLTVILSNIFLIGIMVTIPLLLTNIKGLTELQASLLITPISFMIFIFSPISAVIIKRIGPKIIIGLGFVSIAIGYLILSYQNFTSTAIFVVACLIIGFGYGIIIGPATILAASDFTGDMLTASQSIIGVIRQVGIIIGVSLFIALVSNNMFDAQMKSVDDVNLIIEQSTIPEEVKEPLKKQIISQITGLDESEITEEQKAAIISKVNVSGNTGVDLNIKDMITENMVNAFLIIYKRFILLILLSTLVIFFFPKFKR